MPFAFMYRVKINILSFSAFIWFRKSGSHLALVLVLEQFSLNIIRLFYQLLSLIYIHNLGIRAWLNRRF